MTTTKPAALPAKTPYDKCVDCKVALVLVRSSEKQIDQKCPKCGMQHITGLPASTYSHREG